MDLPIDIKNKIELEGEKYKISDLISSSKTISEKYKNCSGRNERLLTSKIDVISYAIVRMPATFGAISFSLSKMLENIDEKIESILDLGSGTGTSVLTCENLIGNNLAYTCVEREPEMIKFAQEFVSTKPAYINVDCAKEFPKVNADLVVSSYMLNELDDDSCFKVLNNMVEATNKYLLIIDPGTPESFVRMRKIRDYLLSKGLHIVAPCAHENKCPIEKDDWCHFAIRVARSRLHKLLKEADVPYEDEKFSFLAASKLAIPTSGDRVLRHPLINPGMIKLTLCNKEGNIENKVVTKKNKEQYKIAKKLHAGDKYNV